MGSYTMERITGCGPLFVVLHQRNWLQEFGPRRITRSVDHCMEGTWGSWTSSTVIFRLIGYFSIILIPIIHCFGVLQKNLKVS